jgi:hypothetical protein
VPKTALADPTGSGFHWLHPFNGGEARMSPRKKRLLSSAAIPRVAVEEKPDKPKVPRLAFRKRSARRKPGDAHTILSFCASNHISESHYFTLKRQGKGPREIELLNKRIIITPEAEADWRREREAETARNAPERQARRQERAAARKRKQQAAEDATATI